MKKGYTHEFVKELAKQKRVVEQLNNAAKPRIIRIIEAIHKVLEQSVLTKNDIKITSKKSRCTGKLFPNRPCL